jgi:rhodanese-related sulfurtransferase
MKLRYVLLAVITAMTALQAETYNKVKITPDISYLYIYHKGKAVKTHRIQDTRHKLTGEYAKTYRPGTYIQPINLKNGVQTIGEVEVLQFMKNKVNKKKGLILDVRDRAKYKNESLPSAVNIPVKIGKNDGAMKKIFKSLGMVGLGDGSWNDRRAMELVVYCDGPWCVKSVEMINSLLEHGYPANKIFYYRGGFQMWKILGFTTVKN